MDRFFELSARGSTVGREVRGGVTTFMAMAYIILLNPIILGGAVDVAGAKLSIPQLTASTITAAAVSTLLMGVVGNAPFGVAAGLGLNAVVAYQAAPHMTWPQAMGLVVLEGLVIVMLAISGLRRLIMNSIPLALKHAISVGIGMFITLIGLVDAGFVAKGTGTPVQLGRTGHLTGWPVAIFCFGLLLVIVLFVRKVRGAILIGIGVTAVLAILVNSVARIEPGEWGVVVPRLGAILTVDGVAGAVGGLSSASANTVFVESAAGVGEGARTGLAALVTGGLFVLALFFTPIASVVPAAAAAPALVLVGALMMTQARNVPWDDLSLAVPAFLTIALMPFTYSITNGVGAGMISYTVIQAAVGRGREIPWLLWVVTAVFAAYFAIEAFQGMFARGLA